MIKATPTILGTFFALATIILLCAGMALVWPGAFFDAIWNLAPSRETQLMPWRTIAGPGFLGLSVIMAVTSVGCFFARQWGWGLAVVIFAVNGFSDLVQIFLGNVTAGLVGVVAALVILYWLTRMNVRAAFGEGAEYRRTPRIEG